MAQATTRFRIGGRSYKLVVTMPKRLKLADDMKRRLKNPLSPNAAGKRVADAIKRGHGSIEWQFSEKMFWGGAGSQGAARQRAWEPTKKFGKKPLPKNGTMNNTGTLKSAWLAATPVYRNKSVSVGLDPFQYPAAGIQQRDFYTRIRVTPSMRGFLYGKFKVWVVKSHITVKPRKLGINSAITRRIIKIVRTWAITGKRITVR